MKTWWIGAVALVSGAPLAARDLPVPAGKGWQHAESGIVLMPRLAGMNRSGLTDATDNEHDVAAQFTSPDRTVFATVYIFKSGLGDAGVWFDRAQYALNHRDIYRGLRPLTPQPLAFALAGAAAPNALRQVFALPSGEYRSTGLAAVPIGSWLMTVRISSTTMSADALDTRLQEFLAAIRRPAPPSALPAIAPVQDCTTPLTFGKAKVVKGDMADMFMTLLGRNIVAEKAAERKEPAPPIVWCRDAAQRVEYGVYRNADEVGSYALALSDAGRVVWVQPSLMGQVDKRTTYSVTLDDVTGTSSSFPSFSAKPKPDQVWSVISAGKRLATSAGKQITIDGSALQ